MFHAPTSKFQLKFEQTSKFQLKFGTDLLCYWLAVSGRRTEACGPSVVPAESRSASRKRMICNTINSRTYLITQIDGIGNLFFQFIVIII